MENSKHYPVSPEAQRDAQLVAECVASGKQIPPDVARRVQERAEHARRQVLAAHGVQASGVQIIREIRGELPE
ncbi:MAG: hypothetical protein L0Y71_25715 [Gemmataceae bacterium]|nr:hypothetical protein [Gemmataceae bacterium]